MLLHWKQSPRLAMTALVGVTAVWGWTFLIVKDAIQDMPVMDFLAVRFTLAAVVMLVLRPACLSHMSGRGWWHGTVLGALIGMAYITQTQGLLYTSPAISGFITGMSVVFTPVFAWVLLRHKLSAHSLLAVGLACAGLALLSLHGWAFGTGELLTLACAVFVALHIIGLGKWSAKHDSYGLAFIQVGIMAVISLVAAAPGGIAIPPDFNIWVTIGITAVLATAVAFFVQTWAQSLVSPNYIAVVLTMEPVFAGIFSVAFGGERMTIRTILGILCVLSAMLITQLKLEMHREA
ncbi:MAG: permease [Chloroflexi bacterium RBG_16_56_11]|nr:MAG: permease [Chloroflexi bacterium RBG_16_56_11]